MLNQTNECIEQLDKIQIRKDGAAYIEQCLYDLIFCGT
jgi:hypothetical protein